MRRKPLRLQSRYGLVAATILNPMLALVSVRFEIATLRTAESVNLMQRLSDDLCAHPNGANRFSFNPHGWLPGIALSVVQDVTNFHFTLALRAFWSAVHSERFLALG